MPSPRPRDVESPHSGGGGSLFAQLNKSNSPPLPAAEADETFAPKADPPRASIFQKIHSGGGGVSPASTSIFSQLNAQSSAQPSGGGGSIFGKLAKPAEPAAPLQQPPPARAVEPPPQSTPAPKSESPLVIQEPMASKDVGLKGRLDAVVVELARKAEELLAEGEGVVLALKETARMRQVKNGQLREVCLNSSFKVAL